MITEGSMSERNSWLDGISAVREVEPSTTNLKRSRGTNSQSWFDMMDLDDHRGQHVGRISWFVGTSAVVKGCRVRQREC
jgi:hypothetical protein